MSAPPQIWYPPEVRKQELLQLLDGLALRLRSESARQVLGPALAGEIQAGLAACRERLNRDFTLVVLGDFKRGKSTLINALVGSGVLTTNVTPETVTINHLSYGPTVKAEAHLRDGGRVRLDSADLAAERLTEILRSLPEPVSHLVVEVPVDWLRGVRLVDTPGLNDILRQFDQQVRDYLPQADAVIYVISAHSPLSASERAFLRSAVRTHDFPKIFFVVNMLDSFETGEQADRVLASVRAKLHEAFPAAPVFGVSALDEAARSQFGPRPNPTRAGELEQRFEDLRQALHASILLNRDTIRLDRVAAQTEQLCGQLASRLERLDQALHADASQLDQAIMLCRDSRSSLFQRLEGEKQAVRERVAVLRDEAAGWLAAFVERLQQEVLPTIGQFPGAEVQKHFQFFLQDRLGEALNACLAAHQAALHDQLVAGQAHLQADLPYPSAAEGDDGALRLTVARASLHSRAWTDVDTLMWVADASGFSLGTGLLEAVVDSWLGVAGRTLRDRQQLAAYSRQLRVSVPGLQAALIDELHRLYATAADRLVREIQTEARTEIEAALAAMEQARSLRDQGVDEAANSRRELHGLRDEAAQVRVQLDAFQARLRQDVAVEELAPE